MNCNDSGGSATSYGASGGRSPQTKDFPCARTANEQATLYAEFQNEFRAAFPGHEREKAVWPNSEPKNAADCHGAIMLTVQVDLFDPRLCSDPDDDMPQPGWFIYRDVIPPDKITIP